MTKVPVGPFPEDAGYEEAVALDATDALASHRNAFIHSDPELIYLDGNSLGRMPVEASGTVRRVADEQWGDRLIRSWNEGWWELQIRLGDKLAPIVGAGCGEVIISDSTSVNLYKLALAAVIAAEPGRTRIVTDDLNFPTDVYVLEGIARQHGLELVIVPSDGVEAPLPALAAAIDDSTALVSLSHTTFKSGYTYDMTAVTDIAHRVGAMVLWDCSHSVGAVPIDLEASGADLAIGCTYKYLNGGPGSPSFLYVRGEHQEGLANPITGWWGHADPFGFDLQFEPIEGIRKFHSGTMPILSLATIEPGLDGVISAGMPAIREKSEKLTRFLIELADDSLGRSGFSVATPRDPERRGSHVSLAHGSAWPITRAMIERAALVPDFRTPDSIRLGLSPLYTRFVDVHTAVGRLRRLVESGVHREFVGATTTVT